MRSFCKVFSVVADPRREEAGKGMTRIQKRHEAQPRHGVSRDCRGKGQLLRTGGLLEFRGVDVSTHGFGCVMIGEVLIRDIVKLEMCGQLLSFEVMWVETYLGIENNYRVGLHCLDRSVDILTQMRSLGMVTGPIDDGFAAS
jgi:hypothetical protein